ncbi:uncharacterized protein LOC141594179 [Silene latifolia]|uniref:uncharacterized protein LOC141594179 n=1 Tax=Silene latifolia TaxID=37657 RepID=UPI003D77D917
MSDRQKGLIDALATVVPKANIRFCARHIWANLKLRFSGQLYKETFWAAARAMTRADFSKEMEGMKLLSRDAWSFLNDIPPRHWSRHAFDSTCKSHLVLNNVCEVFNAVLKEARDKPILTQLEWMRKYVMQRLCQKREGAKSYEGRVMPYVDKYLDWAKDESRFATFMQSDEHEFEVELRGEQVVVNLLDKTCGCNHWNLTGLPCPHAMACLLEKRMDPKNYVDDFYSKERYMLTYANKVSPMPGVKHWEPTAMPEPLPPPLRTMPGRPKGKKRRKEAGENEEQQLKRGKRSKHCSNCGGSGHYKRTCKNPAAPPNTAVRAPGGRPQKKTEWAKNIREKARARAAQKEAWKTAHLNGASSSTSTAMPSTNTAAPTSLSFTELLSQASNVQGNQAWHQS